MNRFNFTQKTNILSDHCICILEWDQCENPINMSLENEEKKLSEETTNL